MIAGMTASGSRSVPRTARPATAPTSATKPAPRAFGRPAPGAAGPTGVVVLTPAPPPEVGPVTSRNTSSRVGVRRVSVRTPTPQPCSATATGPRAAAPSSTAIDNSLPWMLTWRTSGTSWTAVRARSGSPSTVATTRSLPMARLSSAGGPSVTMRPLSMTPTRPASSSASSRYWVVRKIVTPSSSLSRRTSCHTWVRLTGSSPVVGSSRNRTVGSCTSDAARSRRRFMPPEYVPMRRSRKSAMSRRSARALDRRRPSPRGSP